MEIIEESILCMNPKVCSRSFAVFKEKLDMSVVSLGNHFIRFSTESADELHIISKKCTASVLILTDIDDRCFMFYHVECVISMYV